MDFSLQPDTPEITAFRKEVREWLAENMKGSEHLRWSAIWSTREVDEEYQFRRRLAGKLGRMRSGPDERWPGLIGPDRIDRIGLTGDEFSAGLRSCIAQ